MADSVTGLIFQIGADPAAAMLAIQSFENEFQSALASIEQRAVETFTRITGISKETWVGFGIGVGAVSTLGVGMFELAKRAAEVGSTMFDASEKTGIAAGSLSGLNALSRITGENFDSLTMALARAGRNLTLAIAEPGVQTSKILADLMGGSKNLADLGLLPMDERLQVVLQRIFALNDVGQRNLELQALLGRGWQSNIETLKFLAEEGYGPAIEKAKAFGIYYDDTAAARARAFMAEWELAKGQFASLALVMGQELLPSVLLAMQGFSAFFSTIAQGTSILSLLKDSFLALLEGMNNLMAHLGGEYKREAEASNAAIDAVIANSNYAKQYMAVAADQAKIVEQLTQKQRDLATALGGDGTGAGAESGGGVAGAAQKATDKLKALLDTAKQLKESGDLSTGAAALNRQVSPVPSAIGGGSGAVDTSGVDLSGRDIGLSTPPVQAAPTIEAAGTIRSALQSLDKAFQDSDIAADRAFSHIGRSAKGGEMQSLEAMEKMTLALAKQADMGQKLSASAVISSAAQAAGVIKNVKAQAAIKGAIEEAEAIAAFARWDFKAGALHQLAAVEFFAVAEKASGGGGGSSLTKDSVQSSYGRGGGGGGRDYEGGQGGSENPQTTYGTGGGGAARAQGSQPIIPSQEPMHIIVIGSDAEKAQVFADGVQAAAAAGHFLPSSNPSRPAPAVRSG